MKGRNASPTNKSELCNQKVNNLKRKLFAVMQCIRFLYDCDVLGRIESFTKYSFDFISSEIIKCIYMQYQLCQHQ